jgi:N-acetylneuraminic acid mutarotase
VVGTLPKPLRYAAVASTGSQIVIAGGTSGEAASREVYRFDPSTGALTTLGSLPSPLTHAAAASVGGAVLVFGGREASAGSQTRRILAIAPDGKVHTVGALPRPLSDLAAVALAGHVVLAGGRDNGGRVQDAILTMSVEQVR